MKKVVVLTVVALMVLSLMVLASCGGSSEESGEVNLSNSKYLGTWKATAMEIGDKTQEVSGDWLVTLNEDGTGEFKDNKDTSKITWEPTKGGFKTSGDVELTFEDKGNKIKTNIMGVNLVFEKQ